MCNFLRPRPVSMWLSGEEGTLEKSASLHHPACANLSRLAWARTARSADAKGTWKRFFIFFILINVEWLIGMEGRWGYNKLWSMAQVIRLKRAFTPAEIYCMRGGTSRRKRGKGTWRYRMYMYCGKQQRIRERRQGKECQCRRKRQDERWGDGIKEERC